MFAIGTPDLDAGGMAKKAAVSEVRAWAKEQGYELGDRGRLPAEVWSAWDSRTVSRAVPQPRAGLSEPVSVSAEDLAAAVARIAQLEQQVDDLTGRLAQLEARAAEPRRLFARAR